MEVANPRYNFYIKNTHTRVTCLYITGRKWGQDKATGHHLPYLVTVLSSVPSKSHRLRRPNATSKILQDPQLDLNSAVAAVKSLRTFIESKRDRFEEYEKEGGVKSGTTEYVQTRRLTPTQRQT